MDDMAQSSTSAASHALGEGAALIGDLKSAVQDTQSQLRILSEKIKQIRVDFDAKIAVLTARVTGEDKDKRILEIKATLGN